MLHTDGRRIHPVLNNACYPAPMDEAVDVRTRVHDYSGLGTFTTIGARDYSTSSTTSAAAMVTVVS